MDLTDETLDLSYFLSLIKELVLGSPKIQLSSGNTKEDVAAVDTGAKAVHHLRIDLSTTICMS